VRPAAGPSILPGTTADQRARTRGKENLMLWTIALILAVLWVLGLLSSYTAGGLVHLLLVAAVVMIVIKLFQGRQLTSN
jgi:uncharacterized membrane protein YtjA (UPF0391 family)